MTDPERFHVLVVDDDEDDFLIAKRLLSESEGTRFETEWAASYEQALGAIAEERHDAYLVDYRLGERTGLDLIRAALPSGGAPVILLTGQGGYEVDVEASTLGIADFLDKGSLDPALLERSIRYAISHHHALEEVRRSREEVARSLDEVQSFADAMAHDLKTPIQLIRGYADLCAQRHGDALGPEGRSQLDKISASAERMRLMLDDLLKLVKLRGASVQRVALADVVREALGDVQGALSECGGEVTVAGELPAIQADPAQMRVALRNLLDNAIKFRRSDRDLRVGIEAESHGGSVAIRVADNGRGIPADRVASVFEIFERAEQNGIPGTGIGLALVKKIAELNAGEVAVRSEPEVGTVFELTTPSAR